MKSITFCALTCVGMLAVSARANSAPPVTRRQQPDLLDRAVAVWAKVKTARATFEQTIANPLTGRTLVSTGEYQQRRPSMLSVHFGSPSDDRIVADGKFVWLYLPSSAPDQVIKTPLGAAGAGSMDLSAQFLTAPRAKYLINATSALVVSGRSTHGYKLIPKQKEGAPFESAVVWIDDADASIRQFEVIDASGVQRTVRMTSFKTNVPVNEAAFTFTPPSGVRIVSR